MSERVEPRDTRSAIEEGNVESSLARVATWLSIACAVHCMLVPLLAAGLPLLGASASALHDPMLDRLLVLLVLGAALPSALWSYRRHRDLRVLGAVLTGMAMYVTGHALEPAWYGQTLAVSGALVLAGGSFSSARLSHRHSTECAH